jgi:TolA-binding protein
MKLLYLASVILSLSKDQFRLPSQSTQKIQPRRHVNILVLILFILGAVMSSTNAFAQDTNAPVAPPADQTPPPVAQPAFVSPAADMSTNAAPAASIIVTTPAAARFDSAMVAFNAGLYADAVTAFSDFVRDFPSDRHREEALYRLAESYRNLGRTDDAFAAYTYQVQAYPDGPLRINSELRRGAILFDAGKFSDAIPSLQLVADKGDGELQQVAKYLLGRSFLATQKEMDGRTLLDGLADQQPPGKYAGGAAQALAELDDSENKYSEALLYWQEVLTLAKDPTTQALAAARGGWSALQAKQPTVAEKLFQTARQFDPNGDSRKVANTGLLRILFQQKRYTEWLTLYAAEKDKLLDSAKSEILYDLGQANFVLKHWSDAVSGFDQYLIAFSSQDSAVTAAYERFLALTQIDRAKTPDEAEAYLTAWPKTPYRARVRLLEAQELSRQNKFTAALPLWENLSTVTEDAPWPHQDILLELARAYDELGNFPKAATAYQAYLDDLDAHPPTTFDERGQKALARQRLETQSRLAVCLQKSDQLLAATDAWKAVQSLAPDGSHPPRKISPDAASRAGGLFGRRFAFPKSRLRRSRTVPPQRPRLGRRELDATGHATPCPRRLWHEGLRQDRRLRQRIRHDSCASRSPGANRRATSRRSFLLARRNRAQGRQVGPGRNLLRARDPASRTRRSARGCLVAIGRSPKPAQGMACSRRQLPKVSRS